MKKGFAIMILAILLFSGFWHFGLDSSGSAVSYKEAFLSGNAHEAERLLIKEKEGLSPEKFYLYEGYISREQGDWEESNASFEKAAAYPGNAQLAMESALNRMLNAFVLDHTDALSAALEQAQALKGEDGGWIPFFEGAVQFEEGEFGKAAEIWRKMAVPYPLSDWMEYAFEERVPSEKRERLLAEALIDSGEWLKARQLFDQGAQGREDLFLIGYSYWKEAESKPIEARAPYYQIAFKYFDQIPSESARMQAFRQELFEQFSAVAIQLIERESFSLLPFYLGRLKAGGRADQIHELLEERFLRKVNNQNWKEAEAIAKVLDQPEMQSRLAENLMQQEELAVDQLQERMEIVDLLTGEASAYRSRMKEALLPRELEQGRKNLEQGNYSAAKESAALVKALDPDNPDALYLDAVASYRQGEYGKAAELFSLLPRDKKEVAIPFAVSFMITGDQDKGQALLEKWDGGDRAYVRLGYEFLLREKPEISLEWFSKATPGNPWASGGKAIAYYELQDFKQAYREYLQLNSTFKKNPLFEGVSMLSLLQAGQTDLLKDKIDEQKGEAPSEPLPDYVQRLLAENPGKWSPRLAAARYYRRKGKSLEKALDYYEEISPSTPSIAMEKGEVYLRLGMKEMGLEAFEEAKKGGVRHEEVLPRLAALQWETGRTIEAFNSFHTYFSEHAGNRLDQNLYIEAALSVGRYDIALEELDQLREKGKLQPDQKVAYLKALVGSDHFSEARQLGRRWVEEGQFSPLQQLEAAGVFFILRETGSMQKLIERNKEAAGDRERTVLLKRYLDIADYEKAGLLVNELTPVLKRSAEGLMLLAAYYEHLSEWEKGSRFRMRALKALKGIEKTLAEMGQLTERYGNQAHEPSFETLPLYDALGELDRLALEVPAVPGISTMKGKVLRILGKGGEAKQALDAALSLNEAEFEAYFQMGLLYRQAGQLRGAAGWVARSLKYAPDYLPAWKLSGELNDAIGNENDAIKAFEMAVRYQPNNPSLYVELASLLMSLNNFEDAAEVLEKSLAIDPRHVESLKKLLIIHYNPLYQLDVENLARSTRRKEEIYRALQKAAPQEAEELMKRLREQEGDLVENKGN